MVSSFLRGAAAWGLLATGLACAPGALRAAEAEATGALAAEATRVAAPRAEELRALASAEEAEAWLEAAFPEGFELAEAPEFFEAADEVFVEADEQLLVFAYRSAATGRWIAWVAFDLAATGVAHTAAIEAGR